MAGTVALGVAPNTDKVGVSPLTHRNVIGAQWESTGVVTGLAVSGRSDLTYNVAAGVAVCSRGASDGKTIAYWGGGQTGAVAAGDPSNPRIDTVWITAHNQLEYKDSDNYVTVGVTQGTPSANPTVPTLPSGCVRLADMRVGAGMTSTQNATVANGASAAVPYGVSVGRLAYAKVTNSYGVQEDKAWHEQARASFRLSTRRNVCVRWKACSSVGRPAKGDLNERMGSYFVQCRVDGKIVNDIAATGDGLDGHMADEVLSTRYRSTEVLEWDCTLDAGSHQVAVWVYGNKAYLTYPVTLYNRVVEVVDRGVAA